METAPEFQLVEAYDALAWSPKTVAPIPFESFGSIERLNQPITITEKVHGTNAQILVVGDELLAGSRTRWITPEDDNYGFAKWVKERRDVLLKLLGEGKHFGEWYGAGINAGYGLKEKRFALFNPYRWEGLANSPEHKELGIDVVPILYAGPYSDQVINETFNSLKKDGSIIAPGYNKPEGIIIRFDRSEVMMKRTFESEDETWTYTKERPAAPNRDEIVAVCAQFWQPLRLEKLLSRDERYSRDYPRSLPDLCRDYISDLKKETDEVPENTWKLVGRNVFKAIKGMMAEKGYTA